MSKLMMINNGLEKDLLFENELKFNQAVGYINALIQGQTVSATFEILIYGRVTKLCLTKAFVQNSAFLIFENETN